MAPVLRLIRAAAFAAVCVVVSAAGHLTAGGGSISAPALVVSLVAAFAVALACNGRERTRAAVLAATAFTQIVLHQTFAQVAPAGVDPGHGHMNTGMALVHLTLALLSGWWLHQGESAVWTMLRLWAVAPMRLLLPALASPVQAPLRVRPVPSEGRSEPWRAREFAAAVHRRGPPAPASAG